MLTVKLVPRRGRCKEVATAMALRTDKGRLSNNCHSISALATSAIMDIAARPFPTAA
jgi:hypothetical protein